MGSYERFSLMIAFMTFYLFFVAFAYVMTGQTTINQAATLLLALGLVSSITFGLSYK